MEELKSVYLKTLANMWSIENQLVEALPKMTRQATNNALRTGLEEHLAETKVQKTRIEEICRSHNHQHDSEPADSFATMIEEDEELLKEITNPQVKDAAITASAQCVEHHEIAKYGTLIEWAKILDDEKGEELLRQTLSEEESADKKLSSIAKGNLFADGVIEHAME